METRSIFTARYAETDQMGIVHHSNYAIWFEVGRTDFLKQSGVTNTKIESMGVLLPLYEMKCKYICPARYEDEIVVVTTLSDLTKSRVKFEYKVFECSCNRLLATGETCHAWTDKSLKPINAGKTIPNLYSCLNILCNKVDTSQSTSCRDIQT